MNEHEIERIAAAVNLLRPDWPRRSLITLLGRPELVNRPRRDVTVALAWVACESGTANPGRVLEAGPWWKAAAVETPGTHVRYPAKAGSPEECRTHPGEWADKCRACAGDRLAGDATPKPDGHRPTNVSRHVDALRQALRGDAP